MSSKPPKSDFEATEAEKIQAKVAKAEKDYFNQTYSPLLREMRDISMKENYGDYAAGKAQADTMQALTKPSLAAAKSVDAQADLLSAAVGQQTQARSQGLAAQRNRQVGVLATARGQQADATTGLANVARIESSENLQQAKRRQMMRESRQSAGFQLAGTFLTQGMANKGGLGGSGGFFDGGLAQGEGFERLGNYLTTGGFTGT
tara:strand:- start:1293 stop:1904 length:612 start_codon:yes stop_codon:yes gene_type:complete